LLFGLAAYGQKQKNQLFANHRKEAGSLGLDGAVEFFYKAEKIAAFDSTKTHALGLYRSQKKREGFRYGPISNQSTDYQQLSP